MKFRCFLSAWIAAWVVAFFLPSVFIAYLGLSQSAATIGTGFDRLAESSWKAADDIGPAVKIIIGFLLLVGFLGLNQWTTLKVGARYLAGAGLGLAAMAVTVGLTPPALSRGFAAALTGNRFDAVTTSIYLMAGAVAGLTFVFSSQRCSSNNPSRL